MRFAFTDDQIAFRDAVRELLAKECPPSVVREAWGVDAGRVGRAWPALGEMGVFGLLASEAVGGLGLSYVDLVLLLEETGYAALPEPIVEHAAVAMPLLGEPAASLGGDETISTSFFHEPVVPYADRADRLLLVHDGEWFLVPRADVVLTPTESVDGARRLARVQWEPTRGTVVGEGPAAAAAFDRGALGTAAQLVGLTRRMLDLTVAYATERRQFGVPIGTFQAVKHHLADARIALEFARPLVYRAAWSLATGDEDTAVHVSMAKATASDAAVLTAKHALQCHGAIGYSYEYDLHLFMKRAWALAAAWGDAALHRDRVGRAIL
ncbi:MAG: acyl-CoA/acyl-ACP dehydrogenase [Acidimicrobiia bacterium]|jgi:alkylation response protein AidB-like acyl-CoA dehydrogenase|nr:acyl-CoA/acyl-ACP dehydrogenase [Acidimicrobiia bacterium]